MEKRFAVLEYNRIVLTLFLGVVLGITGCETSKMNTLVREPPTSLHRSGPFPAAVSILPWDDRRVDINNEGGIPWLPLVLYSTSEWQRKADDSAGVQLFAQQCKEHLDASKTFLHTVQLANRGSSAPEADYIVDGRVDRNSELTWTTLYGLSVPGLFLTLIGLPFMGMTNHFDCTMSLFEARTDTLLFQKNYSNHDKMLLGMFWKIGAPQEFMSFLHEVIEDFTRNVEAELSNRDQAYWAEIKRARELRVAKAGTGSTLDLQIANPRDGFQTGAESMELAGSAKSESGIGSLNVFVNGTEIPLVNPPAKGAPEASLRLAQAMPLRIGENRIRIEGIDELGLPTRKEVRVVRTSSAIAAAPARPVTSPRSETSRQDFAPSTGPAPARPVLGKGANWAVVIGISEYQDSRIPALRYASSDAKGFYDWLISPEGGRHAPDRVQLLRDKEATGSNIKNSLFTWLRGALEEDIVTIYFAGHGSPDSPDGTKNLFLLPYDANYSAIASSGFPMWDIETALSRFIKAKRVVVIADSCHSGGVGESFGRATRGVGGVIANPISSGLQELSNVSAGICVISASGENQLSQESQEWGGGHGVFTHYLLEGLHGKADYTSDGLITLGELVPYLSEQVRRATRNAQTPIVAGKYDPGMALSSGR